eukprot:gnl/TRDRNA2_/TRDRNA2_125105_c1_seq1.p1 gnl/TRDRNA2_/TRDRNA2_125105_c1~~gnl/TRDRNA2_/TRDRNA2_125105_c1_seq1.p1  ORF type:complete len:324 (+),score=43.87 gnl/TRDRNA2_/TRDRNA2_125105_c1_seq1:123-974(+)
MSAKRQIRLVKHVKSVVEKEATKPPVKRVAFRKPKISAEERMQRLEEQKKAAEYKPSNPAGVYNTVLIVDGYNVCAKATSKSIAGDKGLKDWFHAGDVNVAQGGLVSALYRYLPQSRYARIVCVFDSATAPPNSKRDSKPGFVEVVETPNADEWIRKEMSKLREEQGEYTSVHVVSSDHEVHTAVGHTGFFGMSAEALLRDMARSRSAMPATEKDYAVQDHKMNAVQDHKIARPMGKTNGQSQRARKAQARSRTPLSFDLSSSLDAGTLEKLEAMRLGKLKCA